jgi:hypothetical protein
VGSPAPDHPGWLRRLATVAVVAAVVSPAVRDHDSFPLSTYPMYADTRGRAVSIATAVGVDRSGARRYLSLQTIADTDDPLIAESAVRQAISRGTASALCNDIAARAGPSFIAIEVVDERHDVVARAARHDSLIGRAVHARCPVER